MNTNRTVQVAPIKSKFNNLWASKFVLYAVSAGVEYIAGELSSAHVWHDEAAAKVAGKRAIETLEMTGRWPNMCELW